jgi:hypothetical protein
MSQPAKAHEPSMEEILASIRRIISDDETPNPAAATVPVPPATLVTPRPATLPPRSPSPTPMPTVIKPPSIDQIGTAAVTAALDAPLENEPADEPNPQDILDLTESMTAHQPEAGGFQTIDGQSDVVFTDTPTPSEPAPRAAQDPPRPQVTPPPVAAAEPPPTLDRTLMSPHTSAAVDSAFNALAQTVLVQNARTLEDLVKEMLRPMLKSWLDDNLPSVVERIVKAEIERVSRGRD